MKACLKTIIPTRWSLRGAILPVIGAALFAGAVHQATADLTIDVRAVSIVSGAVSGDVISTDGKTVSLSQNSTGGETVQFSVWAQLTNSSGGNGTFGFLSKYFNVATTGTALGLTGSCNSDGLSAAATVFGNFGQSNHGLSQDFNGDGSQDLGGTYTNISANVPRIVSPNGNGDSTMSSYQTFHVTNGVLDSNNGVSGNTHDATIVTNILSNQGIEIELATFNFTVTAIGNWTNLMLNAAEDKFSSTTYKNANTYFIDGQNTGGSSNGAHNGYSTSGSVVAGNSGSLIHYGTGVTFNELVVAPEPGTWAMLVGGFGMLALGRRLRRRS